MWPAGLPSSALVAYFVWSTPPKSLARRTLPSPCSGASAAWPPKGVLIRACMNPHGLWKKHSFGKTLGRNHRGACAADEQLAGRMLLEGARVAWAAKVCQTCGSWLATNRMRLGVCCKEPCHKTLSSTTSCLFWSGPRDGRQSLCNIPRVFGRCSLSGSYASPGARR